MPLKPLKLHDPTGPRPRGSAAPGRPAEKPPPPKAPPAGRKAPGLLTRHKSLLSVVGCVLVLVMCAAFLWYTRPVPPVNRAADYSGIADFEAVYLQGGIWMARLKADARPLADPGLTCRDLALRVGASIPNSVNVLSAGGLPVARCPAQK